MTESVPLGPRARRFCDQFGIDVPLIQAPMAGGWTTPDLAASVARRGALGMLAATRLSPQQLSEQVGAVRAQTDRAVGVNFLLAPTGPPDGDAPRVQAALNQLRAILGLDPRDASHVVVPPPVFDEQLEVVLASDLPVVSFAMGNPGPLVDRVHAAGKLALGTATTVDEALALEAAGVDAIVAQGAEAGGHRSTFDVPASGEVPLIGTTVLVPCIVDAVRCPVVASGGLMDGRGLLAAIALGASGAQMGTRFLVTHQSGAFPEYRRRIREARETDTVVTRQFTGRPARSLHNRFIAHMDDSGVQPLSWGYQSAAAGDIYASAVTRGVGDYAPLLAGQGAPLARGEVDAGAVVTEIVVEAVRLLEELRVPDGAGDA